MPKNLTKRVLQTLEPRTKRYVVSDEKQQALQIEVTPRGKMTWYVKTTFRGKTFRMALGDGSIPVESARTSCAEILTKLSRDIDPRKEKQKAKAPTYGEFITGTYAPWCEQHLKSHKEIIRVLTVSFKGFLKMKLHNITAWHFERWRSKQLKAGKSTSTTNRALGYLKAALTRAVDWGLLEENPLTKVKPHREDGSKIRYLSDTERQALLAAMDRREEEMRKHRANHNEWLLARGHEPRPSLKGKFADHMKPLILLSLHTGMRRNEAFSLRWDDVSFENNIICIRADVAKSGKARFVPMNQTVKDTLLKWREQTHGDGLVFPSPVTGGQLDNVNKAWRAILKDAEIEAFRWHDMRHDCASRLAMAGVSMHSIQNLLGHSSPLVTQKYAHLSPRHQQSAVRVLDELDKQTNNLVSFPAAEGHDTTE